jgi:hypothetical protein
LDTTKSSLTVDGGKQWMRHAIKGAGSPFSYKVTWLVGELDGVRCYVTPEGVILTKEDRWP